MKKIAFLGCGNMASAVAYAASLDKEYKLYMYTPSNTKAIKLADKLNGTHVKNIDELENMDIYVLGFKPQTIVDASKQFKHLTKNKMIVSMLAAINTKKISELFDSQDVLRIMPNTPMFKNKGVVLYTQNKDSGDHDKFMSAIENSALIYKCDTDEKLDKLTTIFGCGPAYIYYLQQVLENTLLKLDPQFENSGKFITRLFEGSTMMTQDENDLQSLIDKVTSKGGVTIEAINRLKGSAIQEGFYQAIDKALVRTSQIADKMDKLS
ncbi:MAG: NAD(P)-binding domain-containing protein [Bacteriovoracaceae bacterium]|jgi:pyrroline-5-carboxylate reductase|nr:NAD(P)-binding domain-containing protein [Bacteriovoracaceae bacterium]